MVTSVSDLLLVKCHVRKLTLYVEKPSALLLAKSAGIQITREQVSKKAAASFGEKGLHTAYVALGSNLGDRVKNILGAVNALRASSTVLDTSFLYETPAAYVTDQPDILNGVCKISTRLSPEDLLTEVKRIEQELGRVESFRNGPRAADLDILFYDDVEMKTEALEIPHPRIQEREFVLRPLCELGSSIIFLPFFFSFFLTRILNNPLSVGSCLLSWKCVRSITKNLEHPLLMKTSIQLLNHLQKRYGTSLLPSLFFRKYNSTSAHIDLQDFDEEGSTHRRAVLASGTEDAGNGRPEHHPRQLQ